MSQCTATTRAGTPCRGVAIHGSGLCAAHHPEYSGARQRGARTGGKRGGRGRRSPAVAELERLKAKLERIADDVLEGKVDRGKAAVVAQLLGQARACVRDGVAAREQEEIDLRLAELEDQLDEERRGVR